MRPSIHSSAPTSPKRSWTDSSSSLPDVLSEHSVDFITTPPDPSLPSRSPVPSVFPVPKPNTNQTNYPPDIAHPVRSSLTSAFSRLNTNQRKFEQRQSPSSQRQSTNRFGNAEPRPTRTPNSSYRRTQPSTLPNLTRLPHHRTLDSLA